VSRPLSHAAVVFGSSRMLPPIFIAGSRPLLTSSYRLTLLRLRSFANSHTLHAERRASTISTNVDSATAQTRLRIRGIFFVLTDYLSFEISTLTASRRSRVLHVRAKPAKPRSDAL
jgi:hypothetical protein